MDVMWRLGAQVFREMRGLQLGDVVAYNQAMNALDLGHRWEEACSCCVAACR